jgi:hypothetical protein
VGRSVAWEALELSEIASSAGVRVASLLMEVLPLASSSWVDSPPPSSSLLLSSSPLLSWLSWLLSPRPSSLLLPLPPALPLPRSLSPSLPSSLAWSPSPLSLASSTLFCRLSAVRKLSGLDGEKVSAAFLHYFVVAVMSLA